MEKKPFVTLEQLKEIEKTYPTPFHIYDEKGFMENARKVSEAFSWNKGFREYFAVKAEPNPFIIKKLKEAGCGVDCSSYTELMKVINGDSEEEKVISSRYSIVLASAKRARQIIAGDMPLVEEKDGAKPLSTAVEELWEEKVKILGDDEEAEE